MKWIRRSLIRMRSLSRKEQLERELGDELESHIEMHVQDNLRMGMTMEEARRDALIKLGGVAQTKERVRDHCGIPWLETLLRDVRFGIRMLAKSPSFTAVAVLTLALGIGPNTAIFSFVNAALLRPLPYTAPDRLAALGEMREQYDEEAWNTSLPDLRDWQRSSKSFESFAAYSPDRVTTSSGDISENLDATRTTYNFFATLGVAPILGRDFQPKEDEGDGANVVLLAFPFWKARFGGNPNVLGQVLRLDGVSHTIVGVLPEKFEFAPAGSPSLWLPVGLGAEFAQRRNLRWLRVVGRLIEGVRLPEAQMEMNTITAALLAEHPQENGGIHVGMASLRDRIVGKIRPLFLVLLGAVGFVLLIACANVAHLILARATTRKKEIGVRIALGAGRGQIVRQLLTESVLLSLAGGVLGFLLANWGVALLLAVVPENMRKAMPFLNSAQMDFTTFTFLLGVTLATALVFGLLPAWQMSAAEPGGALKEESRTSTGTGTVWVRNALVIAELAISIVLLTGAGLMVRSLSALLRQDPGFEGKNLLTFAVSLPQASYKDEAAALQFEHRLRAELEQNPGVTGTAGVSTLPVTGAGNTIRFLIEGHPKEKGAEDEGSIREVSPEYFSLMKIPVLQGRNYGPTDDSKAPGRMVVNKAFVDKFFPGENPVGKRIKFTYSDNLPYLEIIGVVANENSEGLDTPMQPILYSSMEQSPDPGFYVVIRTAGEPSAMIPSAREALRRLDPQVAMIGPHSMDEVVSNTYAVFLRRFPSRLISGFAILALTLAAVGLYGQISFGVAQRTREIGVRMALGAKTSDVLRMIVRKGLALTLAGLIVGFAGSLLLTGLLVSLLFGVSPIDPWTMAAAAIVLTIVSVVASLIPARRATRIDPIVALRYE